MRSDGSATSHVRPRPSVMLTLPVRLAFLHWHTLSTKLAAGLVHVLHVFKDRYLQPAWIRIEAIDEQGTSFMMWKRGVGEQEQTQTTVQDVKRATDWRRRSERSGGRGGNNTWDAGRSLSACFAVGARAKQRMPFQRRPFAGSLVGQCLCVNGHSGIALASAYRSFARA